MPSLDLRTWSGEETRAVLGQRMAPQLFEVYERLCTHFCSLASTPTSLRSIKDVTRLVDPSKETEPLAADMEAALVAAIDRAVGSFPATTLQLLLRGLPVDLPCHPHLEAYTIGPDDPRRGLRGQTGVRASREIPAGQLVGVYRGETMFHSDYIDWKLTPPTLDTHPIEHEMLLDGYTASTTFFSAGEWVWHHKLPQFLSMHRGDTVVMICGSYNGNMTSLVNDPGLDPMNGPSAGDGTPNTRLCEFLVGAWPVLAMCTFKRVRAGEEVLYAYGHDYWEFMKEHTRRLSAVNRYGICKNW